MASRDDAEVVLARQCGYGGLPDDRCTLQEGEVLWNMFVVAFVVEAWLAARCAAMLMATMKDVEGA